MKTVKDFKIKMIIAIAWPISLILFAITAMVLLGYEMGVLVLSMNTASIILHGAYLLALLHSYGNIFWESDYTEVRAINNPSEAAFIKIGRGYKYNCVTLSFLSFSNKGTFHEITNVNSKGVLFLNLEEGTTTFITYPFLISYRGKELLNIHDEGTELYKATIEAMKENP